MKIKRLNEKKRKWKYDISKPTGYCKSGSKREVYWHFKKDLKQPNFIPN